MPIGFYVPTNREGEILDGVETTIGVVNGLWQCTEEQNATRLASMFFEAADISSLSGRCQVRVGIDKAVVGRACEVVVLPGNWRISPDTVVDDGRTVNIGDVVVVKRAIDSRLSQLDQIVRKCGSPPMPTENKDWSIGCKAVTDFDANGYAGERYFWMGF